jgi:hypothetical protein
MQIHITRTGEIIHVSPFSHIFTINPPFSATPVTSPRLPGYLPFSRSFQPSASALNTPVLHCHGTADQLVQLPWAEAGLQRLREVPMERQCGNMFWWKSEIIGNVSFFGLIMDYY